jgi:hypothetical protein
LIKVKESAFFFFSFAIGGFDTDFFVVLLEGSQIFSGFREFTFFHTFTDIPVDESSLGVHEIEFVVQSGEHLGDSGGVGDHAHGSHDLGEVTSGHNGGGLIVDTDLETSGAPVNELDGSLGLDGGNGGVDVFGDNVTSVEHGAGHVFAVAGVALGHHGGGFESAVGDFSHGELFVVGFLGRDDGGVRGQHEVDTGVRHQVSLELSDVHVQGTIESQGGGQRGDNLSDESVQVGVSGSLDVQLSAADVVDGFVIEHDGHILMLQEGVGGQDGVVRLNDGSGDLRRGIDGETQLGFLAVVDGKSFQEEGAETGTGTTAHGVEDHEALETGTVVSEFSDTVQAEVDDFFTNGVVTSGEVTGGVFLTGDQLFGVEQLSVGSGSDFIDHSGFEIEEHASGHVLAGTSFGEESVESIITSTDSLIGGHLTIRLNAVFEAEELPAGVTDLDTSLSDVNVDDFSHFKNYY